MSPAVVATFERLEAARQRWWLFSMLCSVTAALGVSLAMALAAIAADALWELPRGARVACFGGWLAVTGTLLGLVAYRLLRYQRNLEAVARRVEMAFPELGSHLINLIQLSRHPSDLPAGFCEAALREAVGHVGGIAFHEAPRRYTRRQRWRLGLQTAGDLAESAAGLLLLIGLAGLGAVLIPTWSSAAQRLLAPWQSIPRTGAVRILEVTPGDTELLIGTALVIQARVAPPAGDRPPATLWVIDELGAETPLTMLPVVDEAAFTHRLPAVLAPFRYRLQIGDSQTRVFRVGVRDKPTIDEVAVTYEYAPYRRRPAVTVVQKHGDLEAPQYTLARLKIRSTSRLAHGHLQLGEKRLQGRVEDDGCTLSVQLMLERSQSYRVHLYNEFEQTDSEPRVNEIRVEPDLPPRVELVKPAPESSVTPGSDLPLVVRVTSDSGLSQVRLEWSEAEGEGERRNEETGAGDVEGGVQLLALWDRLGGVTSTTRSHVWRLDPQVFAAEQTLRVRAVAADVREFQGWGLRVGPQTTTTPWHVIRLVDPAAADAEDLARLAGFHARLWALLQRQLRTRLDVMSLRRFTALTEMQTAAEAVRGRQLEIQRETAALADLPLSEELSAAEIRRALRRLATGDAVTAVRQAEGLSAVATEEELAEHATPLAETQQRISDQLRKLLDTLRRHESRLLTEMSDRPGGDLPGDAPEKLRDLGQKLAEFLKQQKKVIEATERLAKKPVEDFTDEDRQLLESLAAIEDEWSRFLEETHSDFSKLPEQDFANTSVLEELVDIQNELKMAAGALTQKTADIAVPLEQLGAEMAEELSSNIEKWLPDTPDRERWSQEEPLADDMKEAPMAELPGELEDLVGELMEDEEDLFDEMEDVSSSWADSIDKGAGWDAMDGPISNMSARGVTGNRLPNSSEIGGRSGEGRQGRASGEFVTDSAVGKGGRKTPSRLSADPYVKGQVRDTSQDPVGGATGGGKQSGVGGEGLEGPVPSRPSSLERLAARQAELRNRAEAVDIKCQVLNYHPTDLARLLELMAAVEEDLRSGRYESALRRREVLLEGLDNLKASLGGELEIRRDTSVNLPAEIQKEILGSMQEATPAGWETLIRKYFESLATRPAESKE